MMNLTYRLLLGPLLAISMLVATPAFAGDTLQRVIDFKTLRVGMSADMAPMTTANKQGGVMGFDVDLARALANAMRVQLDVKVIPFGDLLTALEKDEIDMVISNMSITPERSERAYFIGPYTMAGKSILTRNSVLAQANDSDQFNRAELSLVALENSTSATFAQETAPDAELIQVPNTEAGIALLLEGKADAMLADMASCRLAVLRHREAGLVTLKQPLTVEPVGIAVNSADRQFQNLVANYLDGYGKTGLLSGLRKKWFEQSDWIAALP
jgi:polar amino acid transport system substrate-binding protein